MRAWVALVNDIDHVRDNLGTQVIRAAVETTGGSKA